MKTIPKLLLVCLIAIIVTACSTTTDPRLVRVSAKFQKGLDAAQKGDYTTALINFKPLAEQGVPGAQHNLGYMYQNGYGINKDYKQAAKWYTKSAEQGYPKSQNNLGAMYENGQGVPKDYKQAIKWYTKAADRGILKAKVALGNMHENGLGFPRDLSKAYIIYQIALMAGSKEAEDNFLKLRRKMPKSQIEEIEHVLSLKIAAAERAARAAWFNRALEIARIKTDRAFERARERANNRELEIARERANRARERANDFDRLMDRF